MRRSTKLLALALLALVSAPGRGDAIYRVAAGPAPIYTNTPVAADLLRIVADDPALPSPALPGPDAPDEAPGYASLIQDVAREHRLPPSLIQAVVEVESAFNPRAVSPKGAMGLMQLMPATAKQYGVQDAFDPERNLRAGTRHLRLLLDEFGDQQLALAAYNAGAGAVRRHGGIPAYRETQAYVRKVESAKQRLAQLDPACAPEPPPEPVELVLATDGRVLLVN